MLTDYQPDIGTFTYTYGTGFETMTHSKIGTQKKIYNTDGQLVEIKLDNTPIMLYTYTNGRRSTETDENNCTVAYTYNDAGQVTEMEGVEYEVSYTYNARAQIASEVFDYSLSNNSAKNTTKTYTYDNRNRLSGRRSGG